MNTTQAELKKLEADFARLDDDLETAHQEFMRAREKHALVLAEYKAAQARLARARKIQEEPTKGRS